MKHKFALLILSALPLVACGGATDENQSAANNQLEAAENVMWNDLAANVSLENEANVATPPAADEQADQASSTAGSTRTEPTERPRTAPATRAPDPAPAAKPAPAPTPEPSPKEDCAPEHRAAGHC